MVWFWLCASGLLGLGDGCGRGEIIVAEDMVFEGWIGLVEYCTDLVSFRYQ